MALGALRPGHAQLGHGVVPVDGVAVALAEVQLLVAGERGLLGVLYYTGSTLYSTLRTYVVLAGGEVGGLGPVGGVVVPAAVEREVHGDGHDAGLVPAQTCRRCLTICGEGTCMPAFLQIAPDCVPISCGDNLFKCNLKDS